MNYEDIQQAKIDIGCALDSDEERLLSTLTRNLQLLGYVNSYLKGFYESRDDSGDYDGSNSRRMQGLDLMILNKSDGIVFSYSEDPEEAKKEHRLVGALETAQAVFETYLKINEESK